MCISCITFLTQYVEAQAGPSPTEAQILTALDAVSLTIQDLDGLIIPPAQAANICCPCQSAICEYPGGYILSDLETFSKFIEGVGQFPNRCCTNILGNLESYQKIGPAIFITPEAGGTPIYSVITNSCCSDYRQFDLSMFNFTNSLFIEDLTNRGIAEVGAFYLRDLANYLNTKSESFRYNYIDKLLTIGLIGMCIENTISGSPVYVKGNFFFTNIESFLKSCEAVG
jgi:hypothetical protein